MKPTTEGSRPSPARSNVVMLPVRRGLARVVGPDQAGVVLTFPGRWWEARSDRLAARDRLAHNEKVLAQDLGVHSPRWKGRQDQDEASPRGLLSAVKELQEMQERGDWLR